MYPTRDIDDTANDITPAGPARYRCRHIFADGRRCGSPSLSAEHFCYYHHTSRGAAAARAAQTVRGLLPTLPPACDLAERSGIQLAIGEVLHLIAAGDIELRRAALLLYGLQTASNILPRSAPLKPTNAQPTLPVEEVIFDPHHGPLAPIAKADDATDVPKSEADVFLEELERNLDAHRLAILAEPPCPTLSRPA